LLAHAKHPTCRTRVSLFVWVITLDLSGMGGPTSSICYRQHSYWDRVTTQAPPLRQGRDTFGGDLLRLKLNNNVLLSPCCKFYKSRDSTKLKYFSALNIRFPYYLVSYNLYGCISVFFSSGAIPQFGPRPPLCDVPRSHTDTHTPSRSPLND
jgi:hypothetical protein